MNFRALTAGVAGIALLAGAARAQPPTPAPASTPPPITNLESIPDKIPYDVPYGAPISLDRARAVIDAAVKACKARGWGMNLAVVDSGANLVAFARMDDAQLSSIEVAQHKAREAALSRRETKAFEAAVNAGVLSLMTLDGMIASRGGIPLIEGGKIIGAVGASGGVGGQDEFCATAGAAVINK